MRGIVMSKDVVIDLEQARRRRAATRLGDEYDLLTEPSEREQAALSLFNAAIESLQGGRASDDIDRVLERMDLLLDAMSAQANS
jgi:hypothetical protein